MVVPYRVNRPAHARGGGETVSTNIRTLMGENRPQRQVVAIDKGYQSIQAAPVATPATIPPQKLFMDNAKGSAAAVHAASLCR